MRCSLATRFAFGSTLIAAGWAPALASDSAHVRAGTLTPEQVVAIRGVGEVAAAPRGDRFAYVVSVPRASGDAPGVPYQEIWIVGARGGDARRFTPEKQRAWAPAFSPDGSELAFLTTRPTPGVGEPDRDKEAANLFVLPLAGGEARLVSDGKLAVVAFRWSPRGDRIAFSARDVLTDAEKKDQKEGRDQVVVDAQPKPQHLWMVSRSGGAATRVTTNDVHVLAFEWAPDADRLLVRITDTPRVDEDYMYSRLALVAASGGVPAPFVRTTGKLGMALFSPSGGEVAWLGATDLGDPYAGSLFVAPAAGGAARELTRDHTGCATGFAWLDDQTLAVAATRSTETVLELVSRQGGAPRTVLERGPIFTELALSADRKRVAFAGSSAERPNEVFAADVGRKKMQVRRLTTTNPDLDRVQLGRQSVFQWRSHDGLGLEGLVVEPLGFVEGERYPLVVIVHGGPESCYRNGWNTSASTWTQLLARNGNRVFMPNYRGSIGRDEAFERGDHGDLMGEEFGDILAGIDALVARGGVDEARVGICGGSYGGYTTAWAATAHSDRFAAAVDLFGITNWLSMQGTSDIPEENALVHWNRPFYANMDLYWERSPMSHVNDCRTPLLLLHGDADPRVPVTQSAELYTALRLLGREVEFVRYPREPHGLRESAHQADAMARGLAWFDRYLKPASSGVTSRR